MTLKERIKRFFSRAPNPKLIRHYVGYFNGYCPECNAHIGTNVFKSLTGKLLVECGACGYVFESEVNKIG
jgi:transcription elongation factor Elf1